LLIAIGHAAIVREREAKTLAPLMAQGLNGPTLYLGKGLAILVLIAGLSLPALFGSGLAIAQGESAFAALTLYGAYCLYLAIWGALILTVSCLVRSRGIALGLLLLVWIFSALVVPRIAVTWASYSLPSEGKIITDMRMNEDMRKLGDGHNAADPAFAKLRSNILAQYDVDSVDDLPVNFRGLVAQQSEEELTATLNKYAEKRMAREIEQSKRLDSFGVISPYVALAGTDLCTHHRFLREAEDLRFDFVQSLNKAHIEKLDYADDIARNKDEESGKRARVSSENWKILQDFSFQPDAAASRFGQATASIVSLLVWLLGIVFTGFFASRRLQP